MKEFPAHIESGELTKSEFETKASFKGQRVNSSGTHSLLQLLNSAFVELIYQGKACVGEHNI